MKTRPLALAIAAVCFSAAPAPAADRPNFLVVLLDDLGYADFSCYGDTRVKTTNIDRLAAEGLRFTQYYVASPICSPSRVALSTGQHPARWRITSFLAERKANEERGMAQWLDPKAPMLARMLSDAGYATGHFGKWHMGGQRDVGEAPPISRYGFDASLTQFEGLGERVLATFDTLYQDNGGKRGLELGSEKLDPDDITWMKRYDVTKAFADRAIAFMKQASEGGRPFYVNVWPDDVHGPWEPPPHLRGDLSKSGRYDGVLKNLDDQLGPLFDFVRNDPELRENTFILLASDNGPEEGAGSAGPLRGSKGTLYEGGIREPLITWGPGLIPPDRRGATDDVSVLSALDVAPSLLTLAGVTPPPDVTFDGLDRSPALTGKAEQPREKPLMWVRPPDRPGPNGTLPDLALRDGDWKLLTEFDGSRPELYDLSKDQGETHNLAADQPDVTRRLSARLLAWHREVTAEAAQRSATPGKPTAESAPREGEAPAEPPRRNRPRRRRQTSTEAPSSASLTPHPSPLTTFINPIAEGADPWVVRHDGAYYWCQSEGNRGVAVWKSDRLTDLGERHVVWTAPDAGPHSREIWAPELHFLDGRWYVYVAASDGQNKNHRMIALESKGDDPLGPYAFKAELYTGDSIDTRENNRWAIDGTVLEHAGRRYFVWSGWEDDRDEQFLYVAPMANPWTVSGNRVRLCDNDDHLWERVGESEKGRGLHEAPQVLTRGDRTFLVYSCSGSWEPTYKLGLLDLCPCAGGDPLNPADWTKRPEPVFRSTAETYGVGHCGFAKSPDGTEDWLVFHAKVDRRPGWRRALFAQPFTWTKDGEPDFGTPVPPGRPLPVPSGQKEAKLSGPLEEDFGHGLSRWAYYGHQQFVSLDGGALHLGRKPAAPINDYRSGEKLLLRDGAWTDFTATVTVTILDGGRDAGLLFRASAPSVGYDAQHAYFAGLLADADRIVLGHTDGQHWEELARASVPVEPNRPYTLTVTARSEQIKVSLDGREVLAASDSRCPSGTLGLRTIDTHAAFDDLQISP